MDTRRLTERMKKTARKHVVETLHALNCSELVEVLTIRWSTRMISTAGRAIYEKGGGKPILAEIVLSAPLWPLAEASERKAAAVHEACHLVCFHQDLEGKQKLHGKEWKEAMIQMGQEPHVCHEIDNSCLVKRKR